MNLLTGKQWNIENEIILRLKSNAIYGYIQTEKAIKWFDIQLYNK